MSKLVIALTDDPGAVVSSTTDASQIAQTLAGRGIDFGRWAADRELPADATQDDILAAYAERVRAVGERGYTTVDVARMNPDPADPGYAEMVAGARGRFLSEHRHADDEVRFFVEGNGVFYLHLDDEVLMLLCEAGDFVSVPAGTTHWFDMGTRPRFTAIRFFQSADGWVGDFTGSDIATRFPTYDQLAGPS